LEVLSVYFSDAHPEFVMVGDWHWGYV